MSTSFEIPYHKVFANKALELKYINEVLESGKTSGNQEQCQNVINCLKRDFSYNDVLLMPSATSALEAMALLLDIQVGDEIIMPSFTFVSTANAFALRGAKIVFADIESETLNLCPKSLERSITPKTKACIVINYGGIAAKIYEIKDLCEKNNIVLLEDAAQCLGSKYQGEFLGSFGSMSCLSFHESKIVQCGEGGALILNDSRFLQRARRIQDKGTNRHEFKLGNVSKYQWQDLGSSYLMSELNAAYLRSQLNFWQEIVETRKKIWNLYHNAFSSFENSGICQTAKIPKDAITNGHIFYLVFSNSTQRDNFTIHMKREGVECVTHYEPLHNSPMAAKLGVNFESLDVTEKVFAGLVRLPIYPGLESKIELIIKAVKTYFNKI
ncbi:MAG: dTDP-4-amino-4,6-dideoxygalactose transaminase [Bdellovibrionaceae bacterium]|nr:dTDP-4-amino-4,6-dideoxygalactose transaminase [Pseudobdellovibrionaceae bacterium]